MQQTPGHFCLGVRFSPYYHTFPHTASAYYPLWRGRRTRGFVPHTKRTVKTDKKISFSVDEKQPP